MGLDCVPETDADIVCDLTQTPWPLQADWFDEIFANNVVEHLPNIPALTDRDSPRVTASRCIVAYPHAALRLALSSWEDPTHLNHFSLGLVRLFLRLDNSTSSTMRQCRFELVSKKLHFGGHPLSLLGRLIHALSPREYEKYWAFLFRPSTLEIHLRVVKETAKPAPG